MITVGRNYGDYKLMKGVNTVTSHVTDNAAHINIL